MSAHKLNDVHIILPRAALMVIFNECDRYDENETGGRIIGTFIEDGRKLTIHISGIIEAGPRAKRSPISFFQDGNYQEPIFRQVELSHPEIEHLGNWHTHHMNGLTTLSGGDIATYQRTVNHKNHNIPFFYALLVVAKSISKESHSRYSIKHYIFFRNDDNIYELPEENIEIVDTELVWPLDFARNTVSPDRQTSDKLDAHIDRIYDKDFLIEFYQGIVPFSSAKLGFYWRGTLELLDGSKVQAVVVEDLSLGATSYSIALRKPPEGLKDIAEQVATRAFASARAALIITERECNRAIYRSCLQNQMKHSSE